MRAPMSPVSNGSPMTMSPTPILKNGMMSNGQQQQQHVQFRNDQNLQQQQQQQQQQQKSIPIPVNIINTNSLHNPGLSSPPVIQETQDGKSNEGQFPNFNGSSSLSGGHNGG